MTTKVRLMLTRPAGVGDAGLADALRAEAARLDAAAPGRLTHRRGFRHPDQALYELSKAAYYTGGEPVDALMEVTLDPDDLARVGDALEGAADRLAGLIRPECSAVVVGASHEILAGTGSIQLTVGARRLPHLTHQDYIDYWFADHSNEARSTDEQVGGMGYRQIHCDLDAAAALARRAGLGISDFDGVPEVYFADAAALASVYEAPGVWEHAFADEQRFVDHSRSVAGLLLMADD